MSDNAYSLELFFVLLRLFHREISIFPEEKRLTSAVKYMLYDRRDLIPDHLIEISYCILSQKKDLQS